MILSNPKLFKYYEKLGYSEKEAFVLATLEYGNRREKILSYVLKTYNKQDDFIEHAYTILKDPKTKEKIQAEIDEENRKREEERRQLEEERKKKEEKRKIAEEERNKQEASNPKGKKNQNKESILSKISNALFAPRAMHDRCSYSSKNYSKELSSEETIKECKRSYKAGYAPSMMSLTACELSLNAVNMSTTEELLNATRSDSYEYIEPSRFLSVATAPTSTFRTTYNTASITNVINNLKSGLPVTASMVRTEEFLNYMDYKLKMPEDNKKFNVTSEIKEHQDGNKLLFLGIQGTKQIPTEQNIVLLLDVSGSMSSKAKETLVILATLLKKIEDGSTISLVTYSSTDHVIFSGKTLLNETLPEILYDIYNLDINGGTYGSAGINMAYKIAEENMKKDGINRVIIITDGDLNFGLTRKDELKTFIEEKKKTGVFFSAIGTGMYNLMDDKLETLAKNGNGNYFVVNSIEDANKCINQRFESLVYPIAVDVKAQVEFNPNKVKSYRLIGYENRQLSHEDFTDDTVIAEPFGSGSYAVAMYEIVPSDGHTISPYKYQQNVVNNSDDIATIKIRYKNIGETESREEEFVINETSLNETVENVSIAQKIYEIAETLRGDKEKDYDKARIELLELTNNL